VSWHSGPGARAARSSGALRRRNGLWRTVDVSLVEEGLAPDEWVLVHAGLTLSKIAEREARETLALMQEMSDAYLLDVALAAEGQTG
jgi:hydrogenase expression/formation protein HypC